MNKIISIEENLPHCVSEVVCLQCLHRWIAVRPDNVLLKDLECPKCKTFGTVINTGQELNQELKEMK